MALKWKDLGSEVHIWEEKRPVKGLKHAGGAPKKYDVDIVKLVKLAKIGCTIRECADVLGVPENVISDSYLDSYAKGRENLKERLRRRQITAALDGNVVMMIWLGKQYLGQTDKQDFTSGGKSFEEFLGAVKRGD